MPDNVTVHGSVSSEAIPSRQSAGTELKQRATPYGELLASSVGKAGLYGLANEGSYFMATNPTPGTGVAGITAANGFDATESLLFIRNDSSEGEAKRIYLDYLALRVTAAGTNGTDFAFAINLDTGNTRRGSGGSAITPVNPNMQNTDTPSLTMIFGAIASAAATSVRLVATGLLRPVRKVIGDTYLFDFGAERKMLGSSPVEGTLVHNAVIPCPPVVLGPTDQFLLHEFASAQSVAASYEFELGFWQR